jgi:hypothetical protein
MKRNTLFCCGLLSFFFSAQAVAIEKEASGEPALALMQALRLAADIHPKIVETHPNDFTIDFDADSLYCHTSPDDNYGLAEIYNCTINAKTAITGAPAKLLHDAMMGLNLLVDAGMSQTSMIAKQVHCRSHPAERDRWHCQWQEQ